MIIAGGDFHSRFQQIAVLDTGTREVEERRREHESGEAREFYGGLQEPPLVGIESTGYAICFALSRCCFQRAALLMLPLSKGVQLFPRDTQGGMEIVRAFTRE